MTAIFCDDMGDSSIGSALHKHKQEARGIATECTILYAAQVPAFRLSRSLFILLCVTAAIAACSFLFHSLDSNRQVDTQMITFAFQFLDSVRHGTLGDFLLTVRKYPLLPSLVLAPLYVILLLGLALNGTIQSLGHVDAYLFGTSAWHLYLLSRGMILACGVATVALTHTVSKRVFPSASPQGAVLLLVSSVFFLSFSTAVRPHIPVAAATMLTLYFSLQLAEHKTTRNACLAFGSSALSFCILQSGFFSLLFPLIAFATVDEKIRWKRILEWKLWAWLAAFVGVSATLGYTFLWNYPLNHPITLEIDLGHFDTGNANRWSGRGWTVFLQTLFGGELLLTIFALITIGTLAIKKEKLPVRLLMILAYIAAYLLCFGMYFNTQGRYIIILLPLLAILGGRSFPRTGWPLGIVTAALLFTHAELFRLGITANTYQVVKAYVLEETTGTIATDIPAYMLGIVPTRASIGIRPDTATERFLAGQEGDLPGARALLPLSNSSDAANVVILETQQTPDEKIFRPCLSVPSGGMGKTMFLWQETIPTFPWLFKAQRMGPDIAVYCRKTSLT